MKSNEPQSDNHWLPCETGAIVDAAKSIQHRENMKSRRQFLRSAVATSAVAVGVGFTGWSLFGSQEGGLRALRNNPNYPGGIACSEVKRLLAQYIDKSIAEVALVESITVHLGECKHCSEIHESMVASKDAV